MQKEQERKEKEAEKERERLEREALKERERQEKEQKAEKERHEREEKKEAEKLQKRLKQEEQLRLIYEARDKDLELKKFSEASKYRKLDNFFVTPDRVQLASN